MNKKISLTFNNLALFACTGVVVHLTFNLKVVARALVYFNVFSTWTCQGTLFCNEHVVVLLSFLLVLKFYKTSHF